MGPVRGSRWAAAARVGVHVASATSAKTATIPRRIARGYWWLQAPRFLKRLVAKVTISRTHVSRSERAVILVPPSLLTGAIAW